MGVTARIAHKVLLRKKNYFVHLLPTPVRKLFITLILITPLILDAQRTLPIGKGFQLSFGLNVNHQNERRAPPFILVTSRDTLPPTPESIFSRRRSASEIDIGQGPVTYYSDDGYGHSESLVEPLLEFGGSVHLHYRTPGNYELNAGLHYSQYNRNPRFVPDARLPENYALNLSEYVERRAGMRFGYGRNFFSQKRLQPYLGIGLNLDVLVSDYQRSIRHFPLLGIEQDLGAVIVEQFRRNVIFDFDLSLPAGLNYSLSTNWVIGLQANLWQGRRGRSAGIQLRYLFRPKTTDNQP